MNLKRLSALVVKERKQLLRDSSNIAIGLLLPAIMLLIFGYGLSMDIRNIRLAVALPETSATGNALIAHAQHSGYFSPLFVNSTAEGIQAVRDHRATGCLFLPPDLERAQSPQSPTPATLLIGMNASDASIARSYESAIQQIAQASFEPSASPALRVLPRMWYNEANESCYFMIPGVLAMIMALIGCMLTALQMAKEYEHGTMESMFVTPMTAGEILLAKMVNNYLLGMLGLGLSLLFSRYLFNVPIRGNLGILLLGSSLFLLLQMAMGLLISSLTKSQFLASQIAMIVSFMPVFLLSGFLYEIPNMPAILQVITRFIPARYYVDFLQTLLLVGNVPSNILYNLTIMALFTIALLLLAAAKNPKRLPEAK